MEALYPILPVAGRFVLVTALLMLLYWSVWRKQATYRAKRAYLITMPAVAIIIALLQVEVYKPAPIVVEVTSNELQAASESPTYSPLPDLFPREGVNSAEPLTASSEASTTHTESATYAAGSDTSLPSHEVGKEWGLPLIGLAYTLIILALFTPFAASLYQVYRMRKEVSVRKDDSEHDIHILMGSVVKAPFSFYRTIFMPLALTEAQRRMIMEHERAHILHRHYIDVWVSETVTRLLWWNPFLWWARAELRNVHEFEADSEVLATGEDVLAYQTILIEEVLHGDVIIANGFNHSFIRRRFVEMLQTTNHRMTTWAKAGTAAWILLTAALMCCTVGEAETVYKTVTSEELQVTSDGAFNVGPKVVHFNHRNVVEKDLAKRDSLLWANAHSIPADFSIHIGMKSEEEQKLFERFMSYWFFIVDHNGWLERGEIPTHESLTEEEARNGIVKAKEHYRELLMQTLSQIDVPLRDTLNLFLEKFGLDFVLPKGKGFTVLYKQVNGEPKFYGRTPTPSNTASGANNQSTKSASEAEPDDEGQWLDAISINPMDNLPEILSQLGNLDPKILQQLLTSMTMVEELSPEVYAQLKAAYPNDNLPSLDSINNNVREIKKSLNTLMLEGMTGLQTGLEMKLRNMMKETGLDTLSLNKGASSKTYSFNTPGGKLTGLAASIYEQTKEETIEVPMTFSEKIIDTSLEEQDRALDTFFDYWFRLSEDSHLILEDEYKAMLKDAPTSTAYPPFEEYVENRGKKMDFDCQKMKEALARMDSEIQPQVKAWLKLYGYALPREKRFEMVVEHKGRTWKTWKFTKEPFSSSLRTETYESPHKADPNAKHVKASEAWKEIIKCVHSLSTYHKYLSATVTTEEYEAAKKRQPDLPDRNDLVRNRELSWTVKELYIESILERLDENVANQVREAIKRCNTKDFPENRIIFAIDLGEYECLFQKEKYETDFESTFTAKRTPTPPTVTEEKTSDEEFISPQWGLERPEGYVRLTDYKKQAERDSQAKQQYDLLMKCINKAKAIFNKDLTDAYGDKHARYVEVEEEFFDKLQKVFDDARIGMLGLGAYRLPDGTIVIEDDRLNLMSQTVNWHKGTTQRDPRLRNKAPTMERDKSPNYAAHNEQTWPVYTHVQTIDLEKYDKQPQVFRGKDCTYVVEHFPIAYDFHWFYNNTQDKLVDTKTGDQYMKRYTEHFHMDNYMWIHGMKGEVIRLISIYPPLPKNVTSVDFIPSLIPDEIRLSNAAPRKDYKKLKVQELEQMEKVVY